MIGIAQLPVAGGLFLGDDAVGVVGVTGAFPISQDQRNTARARIRYQPLAALVGGHDLDLRQRIAGRYQRHPDIAALISEYGQQIVNRVNFQAGRVRPSFTVDASLGADLWKQEKRSLRLEVVVENLMNRLNVINFAGLFSGTAIAPPRSASVRLQYAF